MKGTKVWNKAPNRWKDKAKALVSPLTRMRLVPQNKRGFMDMMVNLMFLFMVVVLMVALIPALKEVLNIAQQSNGLNCPGYYYQGNPTHVLSYNATLAAGGDTSTVGCLAIKLYIPYIVLGILIGGVAKLLYGRVTQQQPQVGY